MKKLIRIIPFTVALLTLAACGGVQVPSSGGQGSGITKSLISISITQSATKTEFVLGETFNYDGLKVSAQYKLSQEKSGEIVNEDVSDEIYVAAPDMSSVGYKNVEISFTNESITKTTSYTISVAEEEVPPVSANIYNYIELNQLEVGMKVIFGSATTGSGYVMGEQKTANRAGNAASFLNDKKYDNTNKKAEVFEVEAGNGGTGFSFKTSTGGYLAASSSSQNQLKTVSSKSDAATFKVSGDYLVSQGTYTRNTLQFNSSAKVFACYLNTQTYKAPCLFTEAIVEEVYPVDANINGQSSLSINDSVNFSLSFIPAVANKIVTTWSSEDTSIATVTGNGKNCLVKGVAAGSTNIFVKVLKEDGSYINKSFNVTVKKVDVTGISISTTTLSVYLASGSQTITAGVIPSNATNKEISWSSNNSGVATVNNGVITPVAIGEATITATTVEGGYSKSCLVTVSAEKVGAWTVMQYVCGSNLESDSGEASADIKEVLASGNKPDDINWVVQTGGSTSWKTSSFGSKDYLQRSHVENGQLVKDTTVSKASMGSPTTLRSFIEYCFKNYKAQKYALILWNHGGAMEGCCYDDLFSSDSLEASEVGTAVKGALANYNMTGQKLEFIGYDCCLMQVQDIAEINSKYFNYMVASEELENGTGWNYDAWVPNLYQKKSTETILKSICDSFIEENNTQDGEDYTDYNDQTLSYLRLDNMATYKAAFETFASTLTTVVKNKSSKSGFKSFMKTVYSFANGIWPNYYQGASSCPFASGYYWAPSDGVNRFGSFDATDFFEKLLANPTFNSDSTLVSKATAAKNACLAVIGYSAAGRLTRAGSSTYRAHGLSLIYTYSTNVVAYGYGSDQTNFSNWYSFCLTYGN